MVLLSSLCTFADPSSGLALLCSAVPCCAVLLRHSANVLNRQLQGWLDDANKVANETQQPVKAIIAPYD